MRTNEPSLPTIDLDRLAAVTGGVNRRFRPIVHAAATEWHQLSSSVSATATETWKSVRGLFHF